MEGKKRKIDEEDVRFFEHIYIQLSESCGLTQKKSLEVIEEEFGISKSFAYCYAIIYPDSKKYKKFLKSKRKAGKKRRKEIKNDPKKHEDHKKKHRKYERQRYKTTRWYDILKDDPENYIKYRSHVNEGARRRYKNLMCDHARHRKYLDKHATHTREYHRERLARIENMTKKMENLEAEIITPKEFAKALAYKVKIVNYREFLISSEEIMDKFGYENRIVDNMLYPKERQLFYTIEEMGFVKPGKDEIALGNLGNYDYSGRNWICIFWILCKNEILINAIGYERNRLKKTKKKPVAEVKLSVYDSDDIWIRRKQPV